MAGACGKPHMSPASLPGKRRLEPDQELQIQEPPLLSDPDSSLSDSEESVFSGLEDLGSDSSEEDTEGVAGSSGDEDNHRAEETSEELAQAAPLCSRTEEAGALAQDEYEEDSSDEEDIRNTVGNVPLAWYDEFPHVGYDLDGKRIYKPLRTRDELDQFLDKMDDPDFWRTVQDKMTGRDLRLTDEQVALVHRLQRGQFGDSGFNPYEPAVDFFSGDIMIHPVTNSRFIQERFERCLDLYLCPRQRKMRVNVDPEDLIPKLPRRKSTRGVCAYASATANQ